MRTLENRGRGFGCRSEPERGKLEERLGLVSGDSPELLARSPDLGNELGLVSEKFWVDWGLGHKREPVFLGLDWQLAQEVLGNLAEFHSSPIVEARALWLGDPERRQRVPLREKPEFERRDVPGR
jgi:hypothetical protein